MSLVFFYFSKPHTKTYSELGLVFVLTAIRMPEDIFSVFFYTNLTHISMSTLPNTSTFHE